MKLRCPKMIIYSSWEACLLSTIFYFFFIFFGFIVITLAYTTILSPVLTHVFFDVHKPFVSKRIYLEPQYSSLMSYYDSNSCR